LRNGLCLKNSLSYLPLVQQAAPLVQHGAPFVQQELAFLAAWPLIAIALAEVSNKVTAAIEIIFFMLFCF
jgi:hypothetical protein